MILALLQLDALTPTTLVPMEMHVLLILALQQLDVSILQSFVTTIMHVLLMLVTKPLETASTLQSQFLHLQIFAPLLLATPRMEFTLIQRIVMTTIHALLILVTAQLEPARMLVRIVTIVTHVLSILAMHLAETVFTPQWFVLISILAPKKPVTLFKDVFTLLNMI
jgi:hypothetical protein